MSENELVAKFNENKKNIKRINKELNDISDPINKYYHKKRQTERFSDGLTPNSIKAGIASLVLILTPWILTQIAGYMLLGSVILVDSIYAYMLVRDKILHNACKDSILKYNKLVLEKWKIVKIQDSIKNNITTLNEESKKSDLTRHLNFNDKLLLASSNTPESYNIDYKSELFNPINFQSVLTDDEIYNSSDLN